MKLFILLFSLSAAAMAAVQNIDGILTQTNDYFRTKFSNEVLKLQKPENSVVMSGYSLLPVLGQLALASIGDTQREIFNSIGLTDEESIKAVFRFVNTQVSSIQGVTLKLANRIYLAEDLELSPSFAEMSSHNFNSDVKNIDFSQTDVAANVMNAWVESQTNNRIHKLVSSRSLTAATRVVILNALYFKGLWDKPFKKESTVQMDFRVSSNRTVKLPTMRMTDYFNYAQNKELGAQILELPYEGKQASLIIVLPNQVDGVNALAQKLNSDPHILRNALKSLSSTDISVALPKFKIETRTDLKGVLENLNIKTLFTPKANLHKMLNKIEDISVGDATQQAFIEVSEEGTEAAAANEFELVYYSYPVTFEALHPFAFYVVAQNNIIFNGVLQN